MTAKHVLAALLVASLGIEVQRPLAQAPTNSTSRWDTVSNAAGDSAASDTNAVRLKQALREQGDTNTIAIPPRSRRGKPAGTSKSDPFSPDVTRIIEEDTTGDAQAKAASAAAKTNADQAATGAQPAGHPAAAHAPAVMAVPESAPTPLRPVTVPVAGAVPGVPAAAAPPGVTPATPPGTVPVPSVPAGATPAPAAVPNEPATASKPGAPMVNPPEEKPEMTIQLQAADINQVLETYADLVDRTILRPATLPAPTITLKTRGQLTRREAKQALDVVLGLNGIAMIDMGDKFVKAVAIAEAGQAGAEFLKAIGGDSDWAKVASQMPLMGQYATHIVQLKYTKPSELVQVLQPFAKVPNAIIPIDSSGVLVLRDFTENVKRMLEMVAKIDVLVPSEFKEEVIPIKYALASDIASALNSLSSGGGGASIGSAGGGASRGGVGGRTGGSSMFNRSGTGTGMGGYPGAQGIGGSPFGAQGNTSGVNPGGTGGTGSSFTQRLQNIINRASGSGGEFQILGQTKIIADERTNSLLVFATKEDMEMIKNIVSKLDIVLAQVLIEAVVIQVSLDNNSSLGVSYLQHNPTTVKNNVLGNFSGIGAVNNKSFLTKDSFNAISNSAAPALPGGFSYLASLGSQGDLDVALNAVAGDTHAKILQRPRIQTSNAKQASLFVGESRPYPVSSYYGGASFGGYASIQQLQIGVTLEITPLINVEGLVVMDIHQKIDSFEGNVTIQGVGDVPVTSSKEAQASVAVRDHDTIMLGGLIETDKNSNNSGVPYLKDIPLLGALFRSSSRSENRNEFIVLIRPTVLPTPEIAALAAKHEQENMPGVRLTEQEIRAEEAVRIREANKKYKKFEDEHPGLLTPEK